ncbi:MAG: DNA polymerase [Myxococcota bacterium]|jgi:DNA polymerase-1|nr:DNA polymerase [Myxococcota bacterium]
MELLHGTKAINEARRIIRHSQSIPMINVDPMARDGHAPKLITISTAEETILLTPARTPELSDLFAEFELFGAYKAKELHKILIKFCHHAPKRWACLYLTEQLIQNGLGVETSIEAVANRYGFNDLPDPTTGFEELIAYNQMLAQIVEKQIGALRTNQLNLVSKIEASAIAAIASMEIHGMPFNSEMWETLAQRNETQQKTLYSQIANHLSEKASQQKLGEMDTHVDIDSDKELKSLLAQLGFEVPNLQKSTLSTLPEPLGPWFKEYSELGKLVSTYGKSFLKYVGDDGRIHPTFEQIGAGSGRMACHSPNLQAMVKSQEHRACFCTDENRTLISADYAACELRILAEMSRDPFFLQAFEKGEDLHARVASEIFQKTVSKTENPELRHKAKSINFGLAYGMGPAGLARTLDISKHAAEDLLNKHFEKFPRVKSFLEDNAQHSLQRGFAQTLSGRRLAISSEQMIDNRNAALRLAKNMPIQGTNADITKIALATIAQGLEQYDNAFLVNAVHDEIVVECEENQAEEVGKFIKKSMMDAGAELLKEVILEVDVEESRIWTK